MTSPETLEATQVAEHHSVVRSCPQSWHDGASHCRPEIWHSISIWRRYGTTWGRRISSMYRRPFKFPGTTTRAVLPFKLIPAHIITLPPLYAVVGWTVGSKCLSPLWRHTRMRPSTFADKTWIHQRRGLVTIAVYSICRVVHKTGALEPCDVGKAEAF